MIRYFLIVIIGFFIMSCSTKPIPTTTRRPSLPTPTTPTTNKVYDEDLSLLRPRYKEAIIPSETKNTTVQRATIDIVKPVNQQVDAILDTISIQNKSIRYAIGYRIQIYVGNVRADADAAKLYTYQTFPELLPYMVFNSPTYRVKIGDFMNKIDAERYLQQVKQQFYSAVILPEKIEIRKSMMTK